MGSGRSRWDGTGSDGACRRGRRRSRGGTCWIEAAAAKRRDILRETLRISARGAGRFRRGFSGRRCTHVGGGLLLVVLLGWHGERVGRCVFGVCARLEVIDDAVPPKVLFSSPRISKRMSVSLGVTSPAGPFLMTATRHRSDFRPQPRLNRRYTRRGDGRGCQESGPARQRAAVEGRRGRGHRFGVSRGAAGLQGGQGAGAIGGADARRAVR